MSVGSNIRNEREKKGFSQKDLADKLFVTPQAVSRWENDAVEPSIETLKLMSSLFGVSIDELTSDNPKGEEAPATETPVPAAVAPVVESPANPPAKTLLGTCTRCGKAIYEGDSCQHGKTSTWTTRSGRGGHHVTQHSGFVLLPAGEPGELVCQTCADRIVADQKAAEKQHQLELNAAKNKKKKNALTWAIVASVVATLIDIWIGAASLPTNQNVGVTALCLIPVVAYMFFALLYCLIMDNTFVGEIFLDISEGAFHTMPGIIFSLDFDGVVFLIVAKILLALLAIAIFLLVFGFAISFCGICSMFAFPYSFAHRND